MRLLRVELRRLLARRLFRVLALLIFVALAVVLGKTAYDSHPPTAAVRAQATRQAALSNQMCVADKKAGRLPPEAGCTATPENFLQDTTFRFASQMRDAVTAFVVALTLLGFVLGASSVGAEWSAGTIAALLIWEPRRIRVLAAKALALASLLTVLSAVVLATAIAAHYAVADWRGDASGVTRGLLNSLGLSAARGVGLAVGAGLVGWAIAGALRNTAAALGVGFAYFVGAEIALRALWHNSDAWLLTSNIGAWLLNGVRISRFNCPRSGGNCAQTVIQLSMGRGAAYLGALALAVLLVFAVTFRQRDVT